MIHSQQDNHTNSADPIFPDLSLVQRIIIHFLVASMSQRAKSLGLVGSSIFSLVVFFLLDFGFFSIQSTSVSAPVNASLRQEENSRLSHLENFPVPVDDIYYDQLSAFGGNRSMYHHRKFLARRVQVAIVFDESDRYQPIVKKYAAVKLSNDFAFLHIWKCGGTTVEYLTDETQLPLGHQEIQKRKWLALLRDPIDRFLSAWAECGVRLYEREINFKGHERYSSLNWLEEDYDFRVRAFLREIRDYLPPERSCHTHAFPQTNFMLNSTGHIDDHIRFVGDLTEMRIALQIAGLRLGQSDLVRRDAGDDLVKSYYFQARRELLSRDTILELCEFYAIDYFLFDFDPPAICMEPDGPLERFY